MDKDYSELEVLFQQVVANMKMSYPLWEELSGRASKLHTALRYTVVATGAFLESFQKISDFATGTRGATRDIGSSLTRLCMRHKSIEARLKTFASALMDSLVIPLQEQIDDWKKTVVQLDKDHAREYKKAQQSVKKASTDTIRLQKKLNKGKADARSQLDAAIQDVNNKHSVLETTERNALRSALVEERKHFCFFIKCLQPIMEQEISMISEVSHLQEIVDNLLVLSQNPASLPDSTEQVISDALHGLLPPPSTLERRVHRRAMGDNNMTSSDGDTLSDLSASSSTASIHANTTAAGSTDDLVHPPGQVLADQSNFTHPPSAACHIPTISDIPLPVDRPHTISSSVYQHSRPILSANTFEPPEQTPPALLKSNAPPTVLSMGTGKVAEKIYARPALVPSKEGRPMVGPLPVSTPTVPVSKNLSVVAAPPGDSTDTLMSEMSSLAEAIRELEANTAALEIPYNDLQAPSCQSLQCSSGYGTMTNVSRTGYSHETIAGSTGEFEGLADALLETCNFSVLDKYCTLPNKRQTANHRSPQATRRPTSAAGLKGILVDDVNITAADVTADQPPVMSLPARTDIVAHVDDDDVSSNFPPPPAPSTHHQASVSATGGYDSDDDFPLPPPPDLMTSASIMAPSSAMTLTSGGASLPPAPVNVSRPTQDAPPVSMLMHSLSVKLASRNSFMQQPNKLPPPVAAKNYRPQSSVTTRTSQGTLEQCSDELSENSLLSQIQHGVRLRRTVSNDRSGPRVPGKN